MTPARTGLSHRRHSMQRVTATVIGPHPRLLFSLPSGFDTGVLTLLMTRV